MALQGANARLPAGEFSARDRTFLVTVGAELRSAEDVGSVAVAERGGRIVRLRDVATLRDGPAEVTDYVGHAERDGAVEHAVTLAVAKRPGANATILARTVLERVEQARARLVPPGITVTVTRDYGETAREKVNELILHLLLATASVTILIGIFLGWREALVVLVAVPVTLSLTLFTFYAMGYTLNRITLFALIFSIGILVDDAIVVIENVYRHLQLGGTSPEAAAVEGVDEVGNPTILATLAVIAVDPADGVRAGDGGALHAPDPRRRLGGDVRVPGGRLRGDSLLRTQAAGGACRAPMTVRPTGRGLPAGSRRRYRRVMDRLMDGAARAAVLRRRWSSSSLGAVALVGLRVVQVKMLPFDNKSEFQVVLDLPEGTTLETSNAAAQDVATWLRTVPEVLSTEIYAGTSAPFNFTGLVRHYFLRRGANVADVQVNLLPKGERHRQSHAIALAVRPAVDSIARRYGARAKIAEIPPGPPMQATLVAEVYAADDSTRQAAAERVREGLRGDARCGGCGLEHRGAGVAARSPGGSRPGGRRGGERRAGDPDAGARAERGAGRPAGEPHGARAGRHRAAVRRWRSVRRSRRCWRCRSARRAARVPLGRFVTVDSTTREGARFRKNLRPVIYVTADVGGAIESPVYAILAMNAALDTVRVQGATIARYNAVLPERLDETAIKWDGEWQVTIEMFRDLGLAFAVVLLLIYVLVVGWFQSFTMPLVIMAPIPLTLIGIFPGHALSGAIFTAPSMIGMIALAGIIVRNSILLVDFIQLEEGRGRSLRGGGDRGGYGARPADRAHGGGGGRRWSGDGAGSDLPGPRDGADQWRGGRDGTDDRGGAAALLGIAAAAGRYRPGAVGRPPRKSYRRQGPSPAAGAVSGGVRGPCRCLR